MTDRFVENRRAKYEALGFGRTDGPQADVVCHVCERGYGVMVDQIAGRPVLECDYCGRRWFPQ